VELIGPYLVACSLLVAAGTAKALRPADTARAVGELVRLPTRWMRTAVRAGAACEAVIGALALIVPRQPMALAVASSYAAFAIYVAAARRRGGALASCGCFGTPGTPATGLHIVIDVALAASAAAIAADGLGGSLWSFLGHQPWSGIPLVLASATGTWLVYLVLSPMARLQAVRRSFGAPVSEPG
jgi:hypothetical protein